MTVTDCTFRTFQWNMDTTAPRVLIAVDDLLLDSNTLDVAKAKVTELVQKYQKLANEGLVSLTLFSTNWANVSSEHHVDKILGQDLLGSPKNRWVHLFSRVSEVYRTYTQPVKVFIISDMNTTKQTLADQFQKLEEYPPSDILKLHFCQIGDAETSYFHKSPNTTTLLGKVRIMHRML